MRLPSFTVQLNSTKGAWRQHLPRLGVIAVAYFAAAKIGLLFVIQPEGLANIWPASGVALAALLLSERRAWRSILATIFVVNMLSNWASGNSLAVSLGFAFANTLESAIGAWLMTRFLGERVTFARLDEVVALLGVATLANAATALLGAFVPTLAFGASYWDVWFVWWVADGLGILIITPLAITWLADEVTPPHEFRMRRLLEGMVLFIVLGLASWLMFGVSGIDTSFIDLRPHMLFPILIWSAVRFSPRVAATALAQLATIALGCTIVGQGLFPLGGQSHNGQMIGVQAYLSVASATTFMLSAISAERKRAGETLQQNEKHFRALVEHSADGIALLRADGTLIYAGPTSARLTGYTTKERIGKNGFGFVHPDDLPVVRATFARVVDNPGTSETAVFRSIRKDGVQWWTEATAANKLNQPDVQAIVVNFRDVTERKQAEELLRTEHALAQQYFEVAAVLMVALNPRGKIMQINRKGCDLLEYTEDELVGRIWFETCVPARLRDEVRSVFDESLAGRKELVETFEHAVVTKSGEEKLVRWHNTLIRDASGNVVGTLCSGDDITTRKRAEDAIRHLNAELENRVAERTEQLQAANRELEAFSYSVSHDLRAPLRAIEGYSRILLEDYADKLDAEGIRLSNAVRANAQKMDQLITDLLALSRATRAELKRTTIDMTAMACAVYHELAPIETRSPITFSFEPLPEARCDSALTRLVWINLISNAIKFTQPRTERRIEIGGYTQDNQNIYYVRDNGVGFNPGYARKLFGVFQRLHKAEEFEGTGVGLAIVQRIVHRHGGKTWAEGRLGQGATFYFSIPRSEINTGQSQ